MTRPKKPMDPLPADPPRARVAPSLGLRVREIRRRMERGAWTSEQAAELASEWGLTPAVVRGHAAEASRQIEAVIDAGQLARETLADIRAAIDEAFSQGDMGAVQRLSETRLKLAGIGAHRDARNDPTAHLDKPAERPFWEEN